MEPEEQRAWVVRGLAGAAIGVGVLVALWSTFQMDRAAAPLDDLDEVLHQTRPSTGGGPTAARTRPAPSPSAAPEVATDRARTDAVPPQLGAPVEGRPAALPDDAEQAALQSTERARTLRELDGRHATGTVAWEARVDRALDAVGGGLSSDATEVVRDALLDEYQQVFELQEQAELGEISRKDAVDRSQQIIAETDQTLLQHMGTEEVASARQILRGQ